MVIDEVRTMNQKRRFTLVLLLIHAITLPLISVLTYVIMKQNAVLDAYSTGRLYLSGMSAIKHYVADELRRSFTASSPAGSSFRGCPAPTWRRMWPRGSCETCRTTGTRTRR